MQNILTFASAVLLTMHCCLAESPKQLKMAIYRCPPGCFIKSADTDSIKRIPVDGIKRVEPSPFSGSGNVYDVQSFFKSEGMESPEGAQAFLIESEGILFVKNTPENIDFIETLGFGTSDNAPPWLLRNEIFVVRFNSLSRNPDKPVPTFSELRKAAGDSWSQVCAMEVLSKSGQTAKAGNSTGIKPQQINDGTPLQTPEMQPSEEGASCALEAILGPDAYTIESTIAFRYQSQKNKNGIPQTIIYNGSSTFWDGQMQVLQFDNGSDTGAAYAVLMRITVAGPNSIAKKTMSKTLSDH